MANYARWTAQTPAELDNAVVIYLRQGFTIASRTPNVVTLMKPKRFSIVMLVIGLILFVLPLLVYIVYYLMLTDQIVEITLGQDPNYGMRSPDGYYWWNGAGWQAVAAVQAPAPAGVIGNGAS